MIMLVRAEAYNSSSPSHFKLKTQASDIIMHLKERQIKSQKARTGLLALPFSSYVTSRKKILLKKILKRGKKEKPPTT